MNDRRLCVFCGAIPDSKDREHILPQWLIALTGDPKRVVNIAVDYEKGGQLIRFSWSSLVVPSCIKCNSHFGDKLEGKVKPVIQDLLERKPISVANYLTILDWLDKVRVGLWLNYMLLQKIPIQVNPHFRIADRIGLKDRMLAVYAFEGQTIGLNAHGVESLIFHIAPSCFGLRINDISILNISADFIFARQCGFPSPREIYLSLDGENQDKLITANFETTGFLARKAMERPLLKPVLQLYQPVLQRDSSSSYKSGFLGLTSSNAEYVRKHLLSGDSCQGVLFRQHKRSLEPLFNLSQKLHFDQVIGDDCSSAGEFVAQVYDIQSYLHSRIIPHANDQRKLDHYFELSKIKLAANRKFAHVFRELGKGKHPL